MGHNFGDPYNVPVGMCGIITNSYSTGSVTGDGMVGGLVGENRGIITNSYSTGVATGVTWIGGLVGYNEESIITNCYSNGSVIGDDGYVGGLVGFTHGCQYTSCFWDMETSGQPTSEGGTGLTTPEMQTESTFTDAGWDFINETENGPNDVWKIIEGQTYPLLSWQKYGGGTGEPNDPYLIYTAEHLNALGAESNDYDKHFKLMADIDLSSYTYDRAVIAPNVIDELRYQGTAFTGVFNGNDHTISNLTIEGGGFLGLFGRTGSGAVISNLGLEAVDVNGTRDYVSGLVGDNGGTITSCYSTGRVSGGGNGGGLVNRNEGSITMSYSTVAVTGIVGVGGLVNRNSGSITDCYSTGTVSGINFVGGLVSTNVGSITNSYSTGTVSGNWTVGGLVGSNGGFGGFGSITSCFWDMEVSGQSTNNGGTGVTTVEMQTQSTFTNAGWDFVGEAINGSNDIWTICEGTNYPKLVWQISPADFVCPDGITLDDFYFFIDHLEDVNCDSSNGYCDCTDLDFSGTVDIYDLEIFVNYWLAEIQ